MSMVERLAKRWADDIGGEDDAFARNDACWWLLAVADELEAMAETHGSVTAKWHSPKNYADYFRAEARREYGGQK